MCLILSTCRGRVNRVHGRLAAMVSLGLSIDSRSAALRRHLQRVYAVLRYVYTSQYYITHEQLQTDTHDGIFGCTKSVTFTQHYHLRIYPRVSWAPILCAEVAVVSQARLLTTAVRITTCRHLWSSISPKLPREHRLHLFRILSSLKFWLASQCGFAEIHSASSS